ncbi:unnamed protein product [Durusdinium trenchii]|uniref:Secreted protein n=1 Tax=Durusdinium trenchii TaxID=1381693 RepID=A0ABP0J1N4_9DINO
MASPRLAVSVLSFLGLLTTCCCRSSGYGKSNRPLVYESLTERVWCCAARTTSRMQGRHDDARTACCAYQPLQQLETGAGEPLMPNASELEGR